MTFSALGRSDEKELLSLEGEVTFEEFINLQKQFLKSGFMEWLIVGNITDYDALKIAEAGSETFKLESVKPEETVQVIPLKLNINKAIVY